MARGKYLTAKISMALLTGTKWMPASKTEAFLFLIGNLAFINAVLIKKKHLYTMVLTQISPLI